MNYKTLKNNSAGFTILELLVAVGIIVVITSITIMNYQGIDKNSVLRMEAHKLAGDIRRAQNMALGSSEFNGNIPAGGWGVKVIDNSSYVIFADEDEDKNYDGTADCTNECLQKFILENNIEFDSNSIGDVITFVPPEPATCLNSVCDGTTADITITLKDSSGTYTKGVKINYLGLIDVED